MHPQYEYTKAPLTGRRITVDGRFPEHTVTLPDLGVNIRDDWDFSIAPFHPYKDKEKWARWYREFRSYFDLLGALRCSGGGILIQYAPAGVLGDVRTSTSGSFFYACMRPMLACGKWKPTDTPTSFYEKLDALQLLALAVERGDTVKLSVSKAGVIAKLDGKPNTFEAPGVAPALVKICTHYGL